MIIYTIIEIKVEDAKKEVIFCTKRNLITPQSMLQFYAMFIIFNIGYYFSFLNIFFADLNVLHFNSSIPMTHNKILC